MRLSIFSIGFTSNLCEMGLLRGKIKRCFLVPTKMNRLYLKTSISTQLFYYAKQKILHRVPGVSKKVLVISNLVTEILYFVNLIASLL